LALCDPEMVGVVFPDGSGASPRSISNRNDASTRLSRKLAKGPEAKKNLIATVPNSRFSLSPLVSVTSPFSNRNKTRETVEKVRSDFICGD
jgi:hypothetical protein